MDSKKLFSPNKFLRGYEDGDSAVSSSMDLEQEKLMFQITLSLSIAIASLFLIMTLAMVILLLCLPRMSVVRNGFRLLQETINHHKNRNDDTDSGEEEDGEMSRRGSRRDPMAGSTSAVTIMACEHCGKLTTQCNLDSSVRSANMKQNTGSKMKLSKSYGSLGKQPASKDNVKRSNTGNSLSKILKPNRHRGNNSQIDLLTSDGEVV